MNQNNLIKVRKNLNKKWTFNQMILKLNNLQKYKAKIKNQVKEARSKIRKAVKKVVLKVILKAAILLL